MYKCNDVTTAYIVLGLPNRLCRKCFSPMTTHTHKCLGCTQNGSGHKNGSKAVVVII